MSSRRRIHIEALDVCLVGLQLNYPNVLILIGDWVGLRCGRWRWGMVVGWLIGNWLLKRQLIHNWRDNDVLHNKEGVVVQHTHTQRERGWGGFAGRLILHFAQQYWIIAILKTQHEHTHTSQFAAKRTQTLVSIGFCLLRFVCTYLLFTDIHLAG